MGRVNTEAELISFAKDLLPIIDEMRDIQRRYGVLSITLHASGCLDGPVGSESIRILTDPTDAGVRHLAAERVIGTGGSENWRYRIEAFGEERSDEPTTGTF